MDYKSRQRRKKALYREMLAGDRSLCQGVSGTVVKHPCHFMALPGRMFCIHHDPRVRCLSILRDGTQCSHPRVILGMFCGHHNELTGTSCRAHFNQANTHGTQWENRVMDYLYLLDHLA